MKKLDVLMIKSYLGPFVLTFFISLFVLVMQFLWKYIDELAGKGLEWNIILELILYASATLVPMALPLAILLSSIMTMGAVAENLELIAAKAAGISLLKLMRPLIVLAILTSIFAFLFANHAMPVANYKLKTLLISIRRTKPAIDIQPGLFYDGITGMVVKVEEKGDDEKTFYNLMIYDHSNETIGAGSVTLARKGMITISDDNRYLSFKLYQGIRYDEREFFSGRDRSYPFMREIFEEQEILIDLSEFQFNRDNTGFVKNQYGMMTVHQLDEVRKELEDDIVQGQKNFNSSLRYHYRPLSIVAPPPSSGDQNQGPAGVIVPEDIPPPPVQQLVSDSDSTGRLIPEVDFLKGKFLAGYKPEQKTAILNTAVNDLGAIISDVETFKNNQKQQQSNIARNQIEWHRKFSLSFACFILFFVGAPLGAIIRKGGLGLPLIFCILIFIVYYVISTIGEKSVKQMAMSPLEGMWISSFVLMPFGLFLTLKASTDSPLFVAEAYVQFFKKIFGRK